MSNTIDIHAVASEQERFTEAKVKMMMRIYRVSRAHALEILAERAAEKAAHEAAKEAEKSAAREAFRRRVAECKKHRANCG